MTDLGDLGFDQPIPALTALQAAALESKTESDIESIGSIIVHLGGQFRLRNDQISGFGSVGPIDDSNTQNLGASAATNLNRLAGGWTFPFDVSIKRFYAPHRVSNVAADPWGWLVYTQNKTYPGNTRVTTFVLDEVGDNAGVGPNDYGDTANQLTDVDLSLVANAQNIPAGDFIGVAVNAPTSPADYFVQVMGGYLELERA